MRWFREVYENLLDKMHKKYRNTWDENEFEKKLIVIVSTNKVRYQTIIEGNINVIPFNMILINQNLLILEEILI